MVHAPSMGCCWRVLRTIGRGALGALLLTSFCLSAEPDRLDNYQEWGIYRGDKKGNQFAELAQINAANVHQLQPVWEYHTGDAGPRTSMYSNPIIVDGRVYVSTPSLNAACIDAQTGEQIWFFDSSQHNEGRQVLQGRNRAVWCTGRASKANAFLYSSRIEFTLSTRSLAN